MWYIIETIKTDAGTMKIPITEDVSDMLRGIIKDREPPKLEKVVGDTHIGLVDAEGEMKRMGSSERCRSRLKGRTMQGQYCRKCLK